MGHAPSPAWIALSLLPASPRAVQKAVDFCRGDPEKALAHLQPDAADGMRQARAMLPVLAHAGIDVLTRDHPAYPRLLNEIPDPPPALYMRGGLQADDDPGVAMVGSRHATPYGLATARGLARDLGEAGITVISGLARGIDAAAHGGSLASGRGRTLGVLGCGLDTVYPPEHGRLAEAIVQRGALLSEFPPGTPPLPHHFPRRNRIISGLARVVVVVEAATGSGSLITARQALDQGREVCAVPGPIRAPGSQGTHALLRQGARLTAEAGDILAEFPAAVLREVRRRQQQRSSQPPEDLTGPQRTLWELLDPDEAKSVDDLAQASQLSVPELVAALLGLELRGLAKAMPGPRYLRGG